MNVIKERKRLESIKEQLEELKEKQREAEAEKKLLMKQLMDDYGCGSISEAQNLLKELEEEAENLENEIEEKMNKLIKNMREEGLME